MLETSRLSVAIGGRTIIEGIDLACEPGRVTAIVGPNGSGKSTLLKALSGELRYEGSARLHGKEISALKPHISAGLRAVLPQSTNLSFPFTVREVVRLGLLGGRSGVHPGEAQRLPERALARVDLDGFAGRFYQELSGGEQQRVQLARVLCQVWMPVLDGVPRYLFLDEPISSLDIRHQLAIMEVARDFARQGGGVLAVLHDLNLTAMHADCVHVMRRGRLAASGPPAEVMTDGMLASVFECSLRVGALPARGVPFVLPQSAA